MNEEQKKLYKEKYYQEKQKGVKFWPDIIYKDVVITFGLFIVLVIMATWIGVSQVVLSGTGGWLAFARWAVGLLG